MFEMDIKVRYSELGQDCKVALHQMLNYFQDSSTFHSESLGFTVDSLLDVMQGWFLLAYDIKLTRRPVLGEELKVVTEPYLFKSFFGYRRYWILDQNGEEIARADSLWILMNIEKMVPVRCSKETQDLYIPEAVDTTVTVKRKLSDQGQWELKDEIEIEHFYLDSNGHVNNSYYCLWCEQYLTSFDQGLHVRIEYRKSAYEGDVLRLYASEEEGLVRMKYVNQNEETVAVLEFA